MQMTKFRRNGNRAKAEPVPQDKLMSMVASFKVMTYNIHSGFGRDRQYRLERIIDVIAPESPDIVALQEVDNNMPRSNFDNQSERLAKALGMDYHHCVSYTVEDGEYGITTLSRFPILNKQRHDISYPRRFKARSVLRTDLKIDESILLHVFNVHLGLRTRERHYQTRRLLSEAILLDETLEDPVIVLGDFNDRPISVVNPRLKRHFDDVLKDSKRRERARTFRWGLVRFRLDHIYVSNELVPHNAYVVENQTARVASDHLPLVANVEIG